MKRNPPLVLLTIATLQGKFLATYSSKGLAVLHFPENYRQADPQRFLSDSPTPANIHHWHQTTVAAVNSVLLGESPKALPPLDLSGYSEFRRRIWTEMLKLNPGQTLSYADLAARVGVPSGARAAGNACGANPIPLLIPCHRILAANGRIGGFSGGLAWKRLLLRQEGVEPRELAKVERKERKRNKNQLAFFERQTL